MTAADQAYTVTPLCPHLGAEIAGLDVRRIGADVSLDAIQALLHEHQLLCFRDQKLEAADVMAFTNSFGLPDPHVLDQYTLPGFRDILVLSNIVRDGKPLGSTQEGFGWHTDLTYLPLPAAYTILYGLVVPPEGADTLFASMYKAYDALDDAERARLRPLMGNYSYAKLYARRDNAPPLTAEQRARTPDVRHPLVRIHPHTGREGMYLNLDDCTGVEGMPAQEGLALIKRLFDFTVENFAYTHKWRANDLLIWDNRGTLHTATPYDKERHQRLVYRTSIQGEAPIAPAAEPALAG
ncbi:TauD/TfdA family dioxygenase [Pigmentiphaga soli]|uniref:TauD/TfdA family dioxygenase n=1 Tax=Pigmentiphaga soli TaxID=1007095 RepID=A0ABP8HDE7_9BURK